MLKYPSLALIPNRNARYVVLDTETTGLFCEDNHIIEVGAVEIINGYLTGNQFHAYLRPRKKIEPKAEEKHRMNDVFYEKNYEGSYESEKIVMENLLAFVRDSLIFAHNAQFDLQFINKELSHWNMKQMPEENFRCSMRIFKNLFENNIFQKIFKGSSLSSCCEFFNIRFDNKSLHCALYDATLTAKLINTIYDFLEKNPQYLENRMIHNASYIFEKKREYGKKSNYSFINEEINQKIGNHNKHIRKIPISNNNNYNDKPHEERYVKTVLLHPEDQVDSTKKIIIINKNNNKKNVMNEIINKDDENSNDIRKTLYKSNSDTGSTNGNRINLSVKKLNKEEYCESSPNQDSERVFSTRKVNCNKEIEVLVYDTTSKQKEDDKENAYKEDYDYDPENDFYKKIYGESKSQSKMINTVNFTNIRMQHLNDISKINPTDTYKNYCNQECLEDDSFLRELPNSIKNNRNYNNIDYAINQAQNMVTPNKNLYFDNNPSNHPQNFRINQENNLNLYVDEDINLIEENVDFIYELMKNDENENFHNNKNNFKKMEIDINYSNNNIQNNDNNLKNYHNNNNNQAQDSIKLIIPDSIDSLSALVPPFKNLHNIQNSNYYSPNDGGRIHMKTLMKNFINNQSQ